jgi:hypothetical protein
MWSARLAYSFPSRFGQSSFDFSNAALNGRSNGERHWSAHDWPATVTTR